MFGTGDGYPVFATHACAASGQRVQANAIAIQVGDVRKKAQAGRQRLAWQGNLAASRQHTSQRFVQ